jgi:hypothetical protein
MCDCSTCGAWAPCAEPMCSNDECNDCREARETEEREDMAAQDPGDLLVNADPRRI